MAGRRLMQVCLATSLATIIVTSLRSVLAHNRKGAVDWEILQDLGAGHRDRRDGRRPDRGSAAVAVLQAIFGVLALVVGALPGARAGRAGGWARRCRRASRGRCCRRLLGFLSVLMGIGGGSFGVPTMSLYGMPIHRAVATAAGFGVIIAVPSVIGFLFLGDRPGGAPPYTLGAVNLVAFVLIIAMTLITTPSGVRLAHAMDPRPLKRVVRGVHHLVALNMIRKALGY